MSRDHSLKPSQVTEDRSWFDRFADSASNAAAMPWFFMGCLLMIGVWLAVGAALGFPHGWVDLLQGIATLITLLVVALLENEQWRGKRATQRKLDAIAGALAHLLESHDLDAEHAHELKSAVGLEKRESISRRR